MGKLETLTVRIPPGKKGVISITMQATFKDWMRLPLCYGCLAAPSLCKGEPQPGSWSPNSAEEALDSSVASSTRRKTVCSGRLECKRQRGCNLQLLEKCFRFPGGKRGDILFYFILFASETNKQKKKGSPELLNRVDFNSQNPSLHIWRQLDGGTPIQATCYCLKLT